MGAIARRQERSQLPEATMTETNHNANKLCQAPARAQQQQGPPCLTSRHRHTLSGAGRRAYGDGETTAGLQQAGPSINDHHLQSAGTRKEASTRSATLTKKKRWKPFSLDKLLQGFPPANWHWNSTGPMARYAEDLRTVLNVLTGQRSVDAPLDLKKLRIAFFLSDGNAQPADEVATAVKRCAGYFASAGAQVKEDRPV